MRQASGGTWDLFRYPGVRSDSDMVTLGYRFKPWRGEKAIVEGADILDYIRSTASENGVADHIVYDTQLTAAEWSSETARWTVTLTHPVAGGVTTRTCGVLYLCSGYYRYDEGYTPAWPGMEGFAGTIVHPQAWPAHLDVSGKRVVVIGSGATARDPGPCTGKDSRSGHHVAALTVLRHAAAQHGPAGRSPAPQAADRLGRRRRALEEYPHLPAHLRTVPALPGQGPQILTRHRGQTPPKGVRRRHALLPQLCAVGPADVPGPGG